MSERKKQYEKPVMEFVKLPGNILLTSGRDPFGGNDVRFSSADEKLSAANKKLSTNQI